MSDDDEITERVERLEHAVSGIGGRVSSVASDVGVLLNAIRQSGVDNEPALSVAPTDWRCKACGGRLGFYDSDKGEMRIAHKNLIVYVTDGRIRIICPGCRMENIIEPE